MFSIFVAPCSAYLVLLCSVGIKKNTLGILYVWCLAYYCTWNHAMYNIGFCVLRLSASWFIDLFWTFCSLFTSYLYLPNWVINQLYRVILRSSTSWVTNFLYSFSWIKTLFVLTSGSCICCLIPRDDHPENVLSSMQSIMAVLLEESEDVREDLLSILLSTLGREKRVSIFSYTLSYYWEIAYALGGWIS